MSAGLPRLVKLENAAPSSHASSDPHCSRDPTQRDSSWRAADASPDALVPDDVERRDRQVAAGMQVEHDVAGREARAPESGGQAVRKRSRPACRERRG